MRSITVMVLAAAAVAVAGAAQSGARAAVAFDNPRVRVFRTTGSAAGLDHRPGVVIPLEDTTLRKAGDARWSDDAAAGVEPGIGRAIVVEPKAGAAAPPPAPSGSRPGEGTFTGMSFDQLFENDAVTVIRARMEVGAREGFHTHAADTLVVHLSGGTIEDTAEGAARVNRWKNGDVEFEARGSSHSARNLGSTIDVVLVVLKP
jgi:quercetin dioxygenase-like cupin family protein